MKIIKQKDLKTDVECYRVIFTGHCKHHTEYIIGNIELVNDYVRNYENAYGVIAGKIQACKVPVQIGYDESITNLY